MSQKYWRNKKQAESKHDKTLSTHAHKTHREMQDRAAIYKQMATQCLENEAIKAGQQKLFRRRPVRHVIAL